nr:MAG TPA: hypothetical protein [Caudoviricetes sp.]
MLRNIEKKKIKVRRTPPIFYSFRVSFSFRRYM